MISRVSRQFPDTSADALSRHASNHLPAGIRQFSETNTLSPGDLIGRAVAVADDARTIRTDARTSGDSSLSLKAGDAEIRALGFILSRFGITDLDAVAAVEQGELLARAVGVVARRNPELATLLASEIQSRGDPAMAHALLALSKNN